MMDNNWRSNIQYETGDEMRKAMRDLLSEFSEEDLSPIDQIENLEEFISESDPEILLEKLTFSMILGGWISALPVPDDTVGLPPRLCEYVIGKVISHDNYGSAEKDFLEISERAHAVSQAYAFHKLEDIKPEEMSDSELAEHQLEHSLKLREIGAGRFMFDLQIEDAIYRSYSPHDKYLKEINGFTTEEAIDFINYILMLTDDALNSAIDKKSIDLFDMVDFEDSIDKMMKEFEEEGELKRITERAEVIDDSEKIEDLIDQLGKYKKVIWAPKSSLLSNLPEEYDEESFRAFLDRMSYDLHSESRNFKDIDEFNPIHKTPLIRSGDKYLLPQMAASRLALLDTFFYDLISHPTYGSQSGDGGGEFGDKWGDYVEEWAYESLSKAFDDKDVYLNPEYKAGNSWEEAADVIVEYGQYLLVFECKSKKLVLESRGGDVSKATKDLEKGIGEGARQANNIIDVINSKQEVELKTDDGKVDIDSRDLKRIIPCVIIGEQYDDIAVQQYSNILDLDRTPFVTSVYDLEIICELLQGYIFISYLTQRVSLTNSKKYRAQDELDLLGMFLENGHKFPKLPEQVHIQMKDYSAEIANRLDYKYGP